jgi:hypothetical protein
MAAIGREQRIHFPAKIRVAPARALEKAMLFGGRQIGRRGEYFLDLFPVIGHGWQSSVHFFPRGNA